MLRTLILIKHLGDLSTSGKFRMHAQICQIPYMFFIRPLYDQLATKNVTMIDDEWSIMRIDDRIEIKNHFVQ